MRLGKEDQEEGDQEEREYLRDIENRRKAVSKSARPTEKSGKEGKRGQGFRLLDALEGINGKPNEKMQQTSKKQPAE